MRHIFKASELGSFKTADGVGYDCKCVNSDTSTPNGWRKTLADALKAVKKVDKAPTQDNT